MVMRRVEIGQRSETVRRANLSAILSEVHTRGPLTRSELVNRTGLTRSAIRSLIGQLTAAELVAEERAAPLGTPGRPSPVVRPNPAGGVALALEVTVDSLAAALVGLGGTVLALVRVDRPRGHTAVDEIAGDLAELAWKVRAERPGEDRLIGVGVAIAGVVRRLDGMVSMAPNLGWRDAPLQQRLAAALQLDVPISTANDADLGALAELRRGAAVGASHVLFISGEVGVGGGVIVDGSPLTGAAGYAGEVGHMPINPDGLACGCGSIGCWETEIGEDALLRRAGHPASGGREAVDAVLREATAGVPAAQSALHEVGRWLGLGLAGLVNVFNPQIVVLGGLFGRIHPFTADTIERELDRRALPAPRGLVRVVPARLAADAPLIGAAELALEPLLADPAAWIGPRVAARELASA